MLSYFAASLGISFILVLAHIVIHKSPSPSGQSYSVAIITMAFISYGTCYWFIIRKAAYKDKSPLVIPFLFLIGTIFAPLASIDIYNGLTIDLTSVNSGKDVLTRESDAVRIDHLELDRSRWLERWGWNSRKNLYHVEFSRLLPVVLDPGDTLYRVWVDLEFHDSYNNGLPKAELERRREAYYDSCRDVADKFTLDPIQFFDCRSSLEGNRVLRVNKYPVTDGVVFLQPHDEAFESFRSESVDLYFRLGAYLLLSLVFCVVASGKLERKGYQ
jgi:hypothetical protein